MTQVSFNLTVFTFVAIVTLYMYLLWMIEKSKYPSPVGFKEYLVSNSLICTIYILAFLVYLFQALFYINHFFNCVLV